MWAGGASKMTLRGSSSKLSGNDKFVVFLGSSAGDRRIYQIKGFE
jgi:hypothetical protein